jgi:hypothetical protein
MADRELTGRCFCGAVRYRIATPPVGVETCYCGDCTRAVGSAVTVWAHVPARHFAFIGGEPQRFASSPGVTRTFCGRCGTSLTYQGRNAELVDVTTATLDDPAAFAPTADGPGRPPWMAAPEVETKMRAAKQRGEGRRKTWGGGRGEATA